MTKFQEPMPNFLTEGTKIGKELSITGKWIATQKSGFFRKSAEYKEMLKEWDAIHQEARIHDGMLSTEIDPAIGQDAVMIHHIFQDADSLVNYFSSTAEKHARALMSVAKPDIHLIRGAKIDETVREALSAKNVKGNFGEYIFGYVKNDYQVDL